MLAKKHRLLADRDFSKLFAKGKSYGGRGLGLKVAANRSGINRIGFVVSTKVSKNAVDRNRIKRRLREIMRAELPSISTTSLDLAFMARSESLKMTFAELRASVHYLLEKAGLRSKKT
jgi:ribonuclease P protein component